MTLFNYSVLKLWFSNGLLTSSLLFLVILTIALHIHQTYYRHSKRFIDLANKIPGPMAFPFIGSAYIFGANPRDILKNLSDTFEKYKYLSKYWIGSMLFVCVQEVKDIETILLNNSLLTKPIPYDLMKKCTGDGILVSSGETWKKHRKAIKPTFSYQVMESHIDVFNDKLQILNQVLETQLDKTDFNIFPFIKNCIIDVLWETIFSTELNVQLTQKHGEAVQFATELESAGSILLYRMFKPWLYMDFIFNKTASGREMNSNITFLISTLKEVISKKMNEMKAGSNKSSKSNQNVEKKERISFLEYILEHASESGLTDEDILNETITISIANIDSSSSSLAFLLCILSRRFDIQENIIREVEEVLGTLDEKPITYRDLEKFNYLNRVILESLRMLSTIPYIARQITEEIKLPTFVLNSIEKQGYLYRDKPLASSTISSTMKIEVYFEGYISVKTFIKTGGYTLPNGCAVVIPFFRLHRDPRLYTNPQVFDPDNFLPKNVASRPSYSFCPFSAGPRDCIAKKFALLQLRIGILSILRRFWLTPADTKLELTGKISMNPYKGVHIGLKKRTVERPQIEGREHLSKTLRTNIEYFNIEFKDSYH